MLGTSIPYTAGSATSFSAVDNGVTTGHPCMCPVDTLWHILDGSTGAWGWYKLAETQASVKGNARSKKIPYCRPVRVILTRASAVQSRNALHAGSATQSTHSKHFLLNAHFHMQQGKAL
jgi:hypothetical protein